MAMPVVAMEDSIGRLASSGGLGCFVNGRFLSSMAGLRRRIEQGLQHRLFRSGVNVDLPCTID
jgi:hypothetical protein